MSSAPVTIATPFAGYETDYLGRWAESLAALLRHTSAYVLWLDNSRSGDFNAMLHRAKGRLPVPVRIVEDSLRAVSAAKDERLSKDTNVRLLWQRVRDLVETEYLLCLESDVVTPEDALELLLAALTHSPVVAAVSAVVPCWPPNEPGTRHLQVWRRRPPRAVTVGKRGGPTGLVETLPPATAQAPLSWWPETDSGVEVVDATSFGCLLMRTETLREASLQSPTVPPGYDQWFGQEVAGSGRALCVHWGVRCGHIKFIEGQWRDYA